MINKIILCEKCNKEFKQYNYYNHACLNNRSKFYILEEWKNNDGLYKCPDCGKSFSKMGLIGHYYRKHDQRGIEFLEGRKQNSKRHNKIRKTKEELSKIYSDSMKKRYKEGKCNGWAHINNDKNRRSYPEKFFLKVFENNNIFSNFNIEEKFPYGKYTIDFLIVELKLIIEIDGQQHFRTEEAIEHDMIRDEYFLNEGFKIYRIKWIDVYKETKKEIAELISFIEDIDNQTTRKYNIGDFKKIKIYKNNLGEIKYIKSNKICECGNEIKSRIGKTCINCRISNNKKVKNRPSVDILVKEVEKIGYCAVGRKYGVSDNSIRKWIKNGSMAQLDSAPDYGSGG